MFGDIAAWKIERDGDGYRLKNKKAGRSPRWRSGPSGRTMPNARAAARPHSCTWSPIPAAATTWNITTLPGGVYLIQESQTGKCLESRVSGDTHVARLAPPLKSDDPRQQWRLESVPEKCITPAVPSKASQTKAAHKTTPAEEADAHRLDPRALSTGEEGTLTPPCEYVEVLKVIDDQAAVVLPVEIVYGPSGPVTVGLADLPDVMSQQTPTPRLPVLLEDSQPKTR